MIIGYLNPTFWFQFWLAAMTPTAPQSKRTAKDAQAT